MQTALLLLSENKDFFPACRRLLGQKQINGMCDVKVSNVNKKSCLIDFAAITAFESNASVATSQLFLPEKLNYICTYFVQNINNLLFCHASHFKSRMHSFKLW